MASIGVGELLISQRTLPGIFVGLILALVGIVLSMTASVGMISAVGKGTGFVESYKLGFKLFWASVWVAIMVMLTVIGGYFLLIIPGIMVAIQLALTSYILVLEGKHGMAALIQSREYLKGYWWAFFGRIALLLAVVYGIMLVIFLPVHLLLGTAAGFVINTKFSITCAR
jgi:hypothetical protein